MRLFNVEKNPAGKLASWLEAKESESKMMRLAKSPAGRLVNLLDDKSSLCRLGKPEKKPEGIAVSWFPDAYKNINLSKLPPGMLVSRFDTRRKKCKPVRLDMSAGKVAILFVERSKDCKLVKLLKTPAGTRCALELEISRLIQLYAQFPCLVTTPVFDKEKEHPPQLTVFPSALRTRHARLSASSMTSFAIMAGPLRGEVEVCWTNKTLWREMA